MAERSGNSRTISRRDGLKLGLGAVAAGLASGAPLASAATADAAKRALRIAFLTDFHVQPERGASDGMVRCLRHVQAQADKPELILNGGDAVMDVFATDATRAKIQADLWRRILKDECPQPIEHCLGNHDIWGWDKRTSRTSGNERAWGKQWGLDLYGLTSRYRSFDRAGWHFIVLDSTQPEKNAYAAFIDEPQFEWLKDDLSKTPADVPVLVLSHIPILSVAAFMDAQTEQSGTWIVNATLMHRDGRRLKDLFRDHPNVKLCLSGHEHLFDRCEYNGVTYACGGSVCGRWWRGPNQETREGYSTIDLFADGTFDLRYVDYGWTIPAQ